MSKKSIGIKELINKEALKSLSKGVSDSCNLIVVNDDAKLYVVTYPDIYEDVIDKMDLISDKDIYDYLEFAKENGKKRKSFTQMSLYPAPMIHSSILFKDEDNVKEILSENSVIYLTENEKDEYLLIPYAEYEKMYAVFHILDDMAIAEIIKDRL